MSGIRPLGTTKIPREEEERTKGAKLQIKIYGYETKEHPSIGKGFHEQRHLRSKN
jgi:hypothetical protein